ncbi:putative transcriptional coactivator Hfi1/Transcriptional adapter 1 [Helianthus annuus]|nr:putative transcriptional coactivator Hfi1/Transcriptional adapter 1 [Helianthus annuus]
MPAVRHCSRVDTFDLKIQMERSLGAQKFKNYFTLLTRYLSLKVGKSEFDKLCVRLIGRENIRLHNELIRAILKNAAVCNTPPPKQVKRDNALTFKDSNGGLQSICRDVFPQSPRKGRTPVLRERKFKDRPSPLGVGDKNHVADDVATIRGLMPPVKVNSERVSYQRIPITAPFGVNIHSNETRKVSCSDTGSGYYTETCHYTGQLPSRNSLEHRLKHRLKTESLDISMDCVNVLNNGLESYLKRVIKPSLELASSRSLHEPGKRFTTSLLDLQMAAMTNPKMLGEDWSIRLEKICLSGFENK